MANNNDQISRATRSKEVTKASYDMFSSWYDVLVGWSEKKFRKVGLEKLRAREGEQVLEIGFGTGHCTLALAQAVGNSGKVYGLDISEGMRNVTQSKVERTNLAGRAELKLGDAAKLPFDADSFDAVFTSFTLELFDTPEIPVVLQQCQRVLKAAGASAWSQCPKRENPIRLRGFMNGLTRNSPIMWIAVPSMFEKHWKRLSSKSWMQPGYRIGVYRLKSLWRKYNERKIQHF